MIVIQSTKQRYRGTRRKIRKDALAKLKAEVMRIGTNNTRQGFKFAEKMLREFPELKNA
jgi:hypothetical protein